VSFPKGDYSDASDMGFNGLLSWRPDDPGGLRVDVDPSLRARITGRQLDDQ
jgi:hypothetical protein